MMSTCTICGTATDFALEDAVMMLDEELDYIPDELPLIGSCGELKCVEQQLACVAWVQDECERDEEECD